LDGRESEGFARWQALYDRATAAGCGEIVAPDEEGVAATDELLAAALPALLRIGTRLSAAVITAADTRSRKHLVREAAAVVRLLDCALTAHARDNGYTPDAWRTNAVTFAWSFADTEDTGTPRLAATVDDAVRDVGRAFVALRRDRLGVAERLSDALGRMLVVYAVTAPGQR